MQPTNKFSVLGFVYGFPENQTSREIAKAYSALFDEIGIKNKFITEFLAPNELIKALQDVDYFLSSYRNEGMV